VGYLFKNVLFRFCNLAKYHESKNKIYYVAFKRELKLKKRRSRKRAVRWTRIHQNSHRKQKKTLEESHHGENGSCGLQHTPNCISEASTPVTWPGVMMRNAREYLAQAGSPTITTEVFPENESDGTWFSKFHCKRVLPTTRPVTSLGNQGAKSFLRGAEIFSAMSNSFKLCPTNSSRGVNFSRGLCSPAPPLVTSLPTTVVKRLFVHG